MAYNPELVKQILGEEVAKLFDGTIEVEPPLGNETYGTLKVGDKLTFKFKDNINFTPKQFIITW